MKKKSENFSRKKKKNEEKEEKSGLEEEIEEHEKEKEEISKKEIVDFDEEEFEEFLEQPDFETGSPSLRRVNIAPETPAHLEGNLAKMPFAGSEENDSPFNYSAGAGNKDKPIYQNYGINSASEMLNRGDIENLGKTNIFEKREMGFMQSSESKFGEEKNFERYDAAKRTDITELGKTDERREIKYKTLSSSR